MKKPLLLLQSLLAKRALLFTALLLFFTLLCSSNMGHAQVYYMTSDANATNLNTDDALNRMNYDGTGNTRMVSSFSNSPTDIEQDLANSRLFIYEALAAQKSIKVVNAANGVITASITVPYSISSMKYDAATDYIYFTTTSGGIALDVSDALYKVKPTETTPTLIAASITTSPLFLSLDIPNNRVFIYESVLANRGIKTFDLTSKTFTETATVAATVVDIEYDPSSGYIYYLTTDGTATNLGANDALNKTLPGAATPTFIKAQVTASPGQCMLLDAGNNRAYIYEGLTANRAIKAVDLTTGNVTTIIAISGYPTGITVAGMASAHVAALTTTAASSIAATSATVGGNVTRTDATVSARGVVYSSSNQTPTIADGKTTNGSGTGSFSASITGLSSATTYYARSYATSTAGTGYGPVVTFSTSSNDANLSAFTISSGTLTPVFAGGTTSYTASVTNATTSITVTPTVSQANATIKVNNTAVTSGSASGNLNLSVGSNTITTVVTAGDAITTKTYTLTVDRAKAAQTITFASTASKTYGNADFAPGATASSGLTVSYASDNTAVATIVSGQIHIVAPGTVNITASQAGDANNLAASNVVQSLTVNQAAVTITANAASKAYGDADPTLTYSITSGALVSGDSFTGALTRDAGVNAGSYNITQGTVTLGSKYTLTFVGAALIINKRAITIQPAPATKVYGDADPAYPYYYRVGSLASTDGMTGSFVRAAGEVPGTYALSLGTKYPVNATTGADQSSNYTITYLPENLTITKRLITLRPVPATKVYGNADPGFPYQFVVGSVAPGEGMTGIFGRAAGEDVGVYALTLGTKRPVNATTGAATDQYYTISFIADNLTITKKTVNVSANEQSKTYGNTDPALTYAADALGFSDSFSGTLTRAAGEGFGTYAISQGTLALNTTNYTLNFTGANLTIGKKTVNVTADAITKTYGDSDPTLTYTADALVSGDSFTGAITRVAGENFGTYAIGQGNLALNSNYTLNFTGANFTINKKTINVAAAAKTKTYGDTDPALTYTADALIGGESFTGAITRVTGESFGTYAINQGSLALSSNYTLNYTGANFTIGKRTIDIYSGSRDVQYGDPDGTIGYSYSGTPLAGDAFSGNLSRQPGTTLGTYATTLGTFQISNGENYDLIFYSAPFNIIPREIQVSGSSTIKIYGDADPAINYSIYSGSLLAGDQITGSLEREPGETAGPYNVSVGTLAISNPNYKLTFLGGYFEVDRAPLTLTIDNKTKVATKPNPALTYSVSGYKNGDTEATAFTAAIQLVTDVTQASAAGNYNIYVNGGAYATNYNVTTVGGTLTVTPASAINTLASATVNGGGFDSGAFDPATEFYSVSIPNGSTSAVLTASVTDPLSTLSVGAYPAIAMPLASGAPYTVTFSNNNTEQVGLHVTAEDGTIKSYYFNINPIPSDAKLSNLDTNIGIIAPSFNPLVTSYTLDVPADTEFLTITPTTHDPAATARVSGGGEGGGTGAKTVAIIEGGNPLNITVRSADRTGTTFYQLYVKRPIRLATLTLSDGHLFPAFDPNVDTYTAKVNSAIPSITVTANGSKSYFTTLVNGDYVNYGDASAPVTINEDGSTTILVKITAGDGETSKTYTINVVHGSSDATLASVDLSSGALDPTFDSATETYHIYLPNATTAFSFTPHLTDATASIKVNNAPLAAGDAIVNDHLPTGLSLYYVKVAAADGVTEKTYAFYVERALSSDGSLSNILVSQGSLSPAFDPTGAGGNQYDVSVANDVTSIDITPVFVDAGASASARLNGRNFPVPDNHVLTIPLSLGINSLVISTSSQDGSSSGIYVVVIDRQRDATLSALTVSAGSLSPAFQKDTYAYSVSLPNAVSTIRFTPTTSEGPSTITINSVNATSGTASASVALSPGDNIIPIVVTAQDGLVKTYTVTVNRSINNAVTLSAIRASIGKLTKLATGPANFNYAASVSNDISTTTLTLTATDPNAIIKIDGTLVASGTASQPFALEPGANVINITIDAADGSATRTCRVTITRAASGIATLSRINSTAGKLTEVAGPASHNYAVSVAYAVSTTTVTATTTDPGATVKINGTTVASGAASQPIALTTGSNVIDIAVTAANGTSTRSYQITVTRALSNIATLVSFGINPGKVSKSATGPANYNYTATVVNGTTAITFTAQAKDAGATIKVNNVPLNNGATTAPIAINADTTVLNVLVTAADGIASRTYQISVTQVPSKNATLKKLSVNYSTPIMRVAGPANFNYIITVSNETTYLLLAAVPTEAGVTIAVNGVPADLSSGVVLQNMPLNDGDNVIELLVTAADGITTRTYKITVTRLAPLAIAAINKKDKTIDVLRKTDAVVDQQPEDLAVKQALSPNGDGVNDRLTIQGIDAYPQNTVRIMNRNGDVIYEAKGYDNLGQSFDGRSSKGTLQQPGTYFYSVEYKKGSETRRKTGYIVIKY